MKKALLIIGFILVAIAELQAQGMNHTWLIGKVNVLDTNTTFTRCKILFDSSNATVVGETRKMAFYEAQGNISDEQGNLIAASNGCWIMDASGDTMLNGSGLNPGSFASSYCSSTSGLPMSHANLFIPYPGDTNKVILFHQVGDVGLNSNKLYYTIIERTLNGGLGGVIVNQKNQIAFTGTLSWGLTACKHANGRDWWVIATKDNSNDIYKVLFVSNGTIAFSIQTLNFPPTTIPNAGQPCFSPDGTKFAMTYGYLNPLFQDVRVFSFNRCTGIFDSIGYVAKPGQAGFGLSFSPDSRYLYYSSFGQVFQLDTDAPDIAASDTLVATYDGYVYPFPTSDTNFWLMYRAANGKIYISPSGGVIDYHIINSPDSGGISCDLQQHALRLPCYAGYGNVNHPNYYLGCDTTLGCPCLVSTGVNEYGQHDFRFSLSPNPTSSMVKIMYLLPQNKSGVLEVYNGQGQLVFHSNLPPWSTLQHYNLSNLADGLYQCVLKSDGYSVSKKLVLMR
jgi:Secretion system C-terminal sorting domain/WD40-like Beta Propeller Repeat